MVPAVGIDELRGSVFPTLLAGRPPQTPGEIALGTRTMKDAGAQIGSDLVVQIGGQRHIVRITGRPVLPDFERGGFTATDLGTGAVTTTALLHPSTLPSGKAYDFFLVRYRTGADVEASQTGVEHALRPICGRAVCNFYVDRRPNEVNAYNQVTWTPLLLAGLLALLATLALGHSLITFVRRRRHDIGILKTFGFTRRQIAVTVIWQANALGLMGLVLGIPLGVGAGRWVWKAFAGQLGVAPDPLIPVAAVALVVLSTLILANGVAAVPAWMAGRLRAAPVLRTE
jgi:hypothetical protein